MKPLAAFTWPRFRRRSQQSGLDSLRQGYRKTPAPARWSLSLRLSMYGQGIAAYQLLIPLGRCNHLQCICPVSLLKIQVIGCKIQPGP